MRARSLRDQRIGLFLERIAPLAMPNCRALFDIAHWFVHSSRIPRACCQQAMPGSRSHPSYTTDIAERTRSMKARRDAGVERSMS